jgi:hypothetical protein
MYRRALIINHFVELVWLAGGKNNAVLPGPAGRGLGLSSPAPSESAAAAPQSIVIDSDGRVLCDDRESQRWSPPSPVAESMHGAQPAGGGPALVPGAVAARPGV